MSIDSSNSSSPSASASSQLGATESSSSSSCCSASATVLSSNSVSKKRKYSTTHDSQEKDEDQMEIDTSISSSSSSSSSSSASASCCRFLSSASHLTSSSASSSSSSPPINLIRWFQIDCDSSANLFQYLSLKDLAEFNSVCSQTREYMIHLPAHVLPSIQCNQGHYACIIDNLIHARSSKWMNMLVKSIHVEGEVVEQWLMTQCFYSIAMFRRVTKIQLKVKIALLHQSRTSMNLCWTAMQLILQHLIIECCYDDCYHPFEYEYRGRFRKQKPPFALPNWQPIFDSIVLLKRLTTLALRGMWNLFDLPYAEERARVIAALQSLSFESLSVLKCLTAFEFDMLAPCSRNQVMEIIACPSITNLRVGQWVASPELGHSAATTIADNFALLHCLPNLQHIRLNTMKLTKGVTADCLAELCNYQSLTSLEVPTFSPDLTEHDYQPMSKFTRLQSIDYRSEKDVVIPSLFLSSIPMIPGLTSILFRYVRLSAFQLRQLLKEIPKLQRLVLYRSYLESMQPFAYAQSLNTLVCRNCWKSTPRNRINWTELPAIRSLCTLEIHEPWFKPLLTPPAEMDQLQQQLITRLPGVKLIIDSEC